MLSLKIEGPLGPSRSNRDQTSSSYPTFFIRNPSFHIPSFLWSEPAPVSSLARGRNLSLLVVPVKTESYPINQRTHDDPGRPSQYVVILRKRRISLRVGAFCVGHRFFPQVAQDDIRSYRPSLPAPSCPTLVRGHLSSLRFI
jgi:hypothetical protein